MFHKGHIESVVKIECEPKKLLGEEETSKGIVRETLSFFQPKGHMPHSSFINPGT